MGEESRVGVKIPSRGLSDTFLPGKNKWNILPGVSVPQIQRQTSVTIRFGNWSIPQVQSFDILNVSGVGQVLPMLLEREGALLVFVPHLLAVELGGGWPYQEIVPGPSLKPSRAAQPVTRRWAELPSVVSCVRPVQLASVSEKTDTKPAGCHLLVD